MQKKDYVHGYSEKETVRLSDQARTLAEILHHDTLFPPKSRVLEPGCGTGAQTVILAKSSPEAHIVSIDISQASLTKAQIETEQRGITNVEFRLADLYDLPLEKESFDHVFVCFLLEHLPRPLEALTKLKALLKPGGTITAIEGDHGSAYFFPRSEAARKAIQCQIQLQEESGGNALIGRELYPLLHKAGFESIRVSPRMVYVDASRPELVEGFTKNTFTAMIEGVREKALSTRIIDQNTFDDGVRDLYRTTEADGVFCYTFFKAIGEKKAS